MDSGVAILMCIFFSIICGIMANNKGRNVALWSIGGFFGGIFTVIIIALLSNLKDE